MTRHRWLAAAIVVGLVLAGCGQKKGVHVSSGAGAAGQSNAFDSVTRREVDALGSIIL